MKVVLFDIDHTLMHSPKGANARASEAMFKQIFGIEAHEDLVEKVGMTEWGLIEKVLDEMNVNLLTAPGGQQKIPDSAYQYWAQALDREFQNEKPNIAVGMMEFLEALCELEDVKLGLLTGNSYWRSEVKLKHCGLDLFFRDRTGKLIGAFGNEARTRQGLIAFAEDRLVFLHDRLMIVDDSLLGAEMCRDHQLFSVLVATGSASLEDLQKYSPNVFADLGEGRWKVAVELIRQVQIGA